MLHDGLEIRFQKWLPNKWKPTAVTLPARQQDNLQSLAHPSCPFGELISTQSGHVDVGDQYFNLLIYREPFQSLGSRFCGQHLALQGWQALLRSLQGRAGRRPRQEQFVPSSVSNHATIPTLIDLTLGSRGWFLPTNRTIHRVSRNQGCLSLTRLDQAMRRVRSLHQDAQSVCFL